MAEEPVVTIPVQKVLDRLDNKMDKILDKLDEKAEAGEVRALHNRVQTAESRLETIMTWKQQHVAETAAFDRKVEELKTESLQDDAVQKYKNRTKILFWSQAAEFGSFLVLIARHFKF